MNRRRLIAVEMQNSDLLLYTLLFGEGLAGGLQFTYTDGVPEAGFDKLARLGKTIHAAGERLAVTKRRVDTALGSPVKLRELLEKVVETAPDTKWGKDAQAKLESLNPLWSVKDRIQSWRPALNPWKSPTGCRARRWTRSTFARRALPPKRATARKISHAAASWPGGWWSAGCGG